MSHTISMLFAESLDELHLTDKQKSVLQASLMLFSEKGFENTTTGDIAQTAGVAEGTVYKQFKSKEELLKAIIQPAVAQVIPKVAIEFVDAITSTPTTNFDDFLQDVLQNRLQFAADNLPQLRIFAREILINSKMKQQILDEAATLVTGRLGKILEYYQQQHQLVNWPTIRIFRCIAGVIGSYLLPVILESGGTLDVKQASFEAKAFLLKGLAPEN